MSPSPYGAAPRTFTPLDSRQRLVDQLINSISQPQDIDQVKDLLEEVETEDIDGLREYYLLFSRWLAS